MTGEKTSMVTQKHDRNAGGRIPRPAHVMQLIATNFYGGPDRQILGQALAMDNKRFRTTIAAFSEGGKDAELVRRAAAAGLPAETVPVRHAYDPRAVGLITELLRRESVDLLVTHGYRSNLLGRKAARRYGIAHLVVTRGWTTENLKVRLYHALDKFTLRRSEMIVCVSENKKTELTAAGIPTAKLTVIPNAVNAADPRKRPSVNWRGKYGWPPTVPIVVSAGRLSPEKGPDIFLAAAEILREQGLPAKFIIFGSGPLAGQLQTRIENGNQAGIVILAGHVTDLRDELSAFDLLANPSRSEGMPNIVLEAMAAGLPVVATDVGGVAELIEDGRTGRLVAPGDPAILAVAIRNALAQPERTDEMARAAQEKVKREFSFETQARSYADIYDRLLRGQ